MSEKNAQPGPGRGDRLYRLSQAGRRINESLDVDREGGINIRRGVRLPDAP